MLPSISLAFTLELGLLIATTVPMPYCLADFKTEGESSKKMLFALSNLISSSNCCQNS
jgi:hypothetical protein